MSNWDVPSGDNKINIKKALRKKKLIKILNICSYVLSILFIGVFIIALCVSCNGKTVDDEGHIVERYEPNNVVERYEPKRVIFDDSGYRVDFENGDMFDFGDNVDTSYFDDYSFDIYAESSLDVLILDEESFHLSLADGNSLEFISAEEDYFVINFFDSGVTFQYSNTTYDLGEMYILCDYRAYSTFKSFLEEYEVISSINEELFDAVTDTVTNFIVTLGSGITAVLGLFWANNSLTVLGTLTVIVVSVALAYFVFRLFIGLIRLRG